jgi:hypothetical protein
VGDPTVAAEVAEIVSLSFVFSKEYKERRSWGRLGMRALGMVERFIIACVCMQG